MRAWCCGVMLLLFFGCSTPQKSSNPYEEYLWQFFALDNNFSRTYDIDPNAHINLRQAWAYTQGAGAKIAIIDEGFEVTHEDLAGAIFATFNAEDNSSDVYAFSAHGTAVAGVVAALDNSIGIVGVAPKAQMLLIKINLFSDTQIILAFDKAIAAGVDVINCSWGTYNVSEFVGIKIQEAYEAGIVVVFAVDNKSYNLDALSINDESELPWVIGVGASDAKNRRAIYSDYGSAMDVIAPAGESSHIGVLVADRMGIEGEFGQLGLVSNHYAFRDGTSFASPIVAGVAALIKSVNRELNASQVHQIIIDTAQKIGDENTTYLDGFNAYYGYGKIDAHAAVRRALGY